MRILIMNGPNLGHLGQRQPEIYGLQGMELVPALVLELMGDQAPELVFYQSNHEGALIDRLESGRKGGSDPVDGVALNAGAFTHTSLALADCLAWVGLPVAEVHLSNILARPEKIRHRSLLSPHCIGIISGFGLLGYALAVQALHKKISE